jgi:hypothetical protein
VKVGGRPNSKIPSIFDHRVRNPSIIESYYQQDWKEGERWERNLWDGRLVRQKTWQTCYDVTAEWTYPQTKQRYLFREPGLV